MTNESQTPCPICGEDAELGCVYGPDGWEGLRWRAGEPSVWGNIATSTLGGIDIGENDGFFRGPHVRGIRCEACARIILDCRSGGGEEGPGFEIITQASDLEQAGEWQQALKLYRSVLAEPDYRAYHAYAQNGIQSIEQKMRMSNDE